jgi:hypothetical protein
MQMYTVIDDAAVRYASSERAPAWLLLAQPLRIEFGSPARTSRARALARSKESRALGRSKGWGLSTCSLNRMARWACYNRPMTLVEVTYELQAPLRPEQLRALGQFANTYGLRRFRVDEQLNRLSFEYDASRLKEAEVAHVLRMARIPVQRRV